MLYAFPQNKKHKGAIMFNTMTLSGGQIGVVEKREGRLRLVAMLPPKAVYDDPSRAFCAAQNTRPDAEREARFVRWADKHYARWDRQRRKGKS